MKIAILALEKLEENRSVQCTKTTRTRAEIALEDRRRDGKRQTTPTFTMNYNYENCGIAIGQPL